MVPRPLICLTERLVSGDSSDIVLGPFQRPEKAVQFTWFQFTKSVVALHPLLSSRTKILLTSKVVLSRLASEKYALNLSPFEVFVFVDVLSVRSHCNLDSVRRFEIVKHVFGCQQHSHTEAGAGNGFNIMLSSAIIVGSSLIRIVVEVQNLSVRDDVDYDALEGIHHEVQDEYSTMQESTMM